MKEDKSVEKVDQSEINRLLEWYKGIYILQLNLQGAGFGAMLLQTLNQIRYCERNGLMPVVNYDESCQSHFFDRKYGENMWDQYFEPLVPPFDYSTIQKYREDSAHLLSSFDFYNLEDSEMLHICEHDERSIFSYTFADWRLSPPEDIVAWYDHQRLKGHETFSKYIQIKPSITSRINAFWKANLVGYQVLGIHIRGTDLTYAPPVSPAEYFHHIDDWVESHEQPRVFVATDQQQYLDAFKARYGDRVVSYDSNRSSNEEAIFNLKNISPYRKGEDVLFDMCLLSKADFLIKGASALSEFAMYMNPQLNCLDLSIKKRYSFGQDYGSGWNGGAVKETKPAWSLIKNTNLLHVADNARSQTALQAKLYKYRPLYSPMVLFSQRVKKAMMKVIGSKKT